MKPLTELTNEELWELFPIILEEHNPVWPERFQAEKRLLEAALGSLALRIRHIGSTAVPGLTAKPTIDILVEIKDKPDSNDLICILQENNYIFSAQPENPPPHMMFLKGYTPQGFCGQAYHVHVRYWGDWDEPLFCAYLREHPQDAEAYGLLKRELQKRYRHNRDGYTAAKASFIRNIMRKIRNIRVGAE